MHSSDRTLLAKLGFADPDKREHLHDLACQYIAQPKVVETMGLTIFDLDQNPRDLEFEASKRAKFECPISKGEGQYKTTIGFVDVVLPMGYKSSLGEKWNSVPVFVEVKIKPVGFGEILRQIKLYEEYLGYQFRQFWVLVAAFDMSATLVRGLRDEQIKPVQLGSKFRAWVAEEKTASRAVDVTTI